MRVDKGDWKGAISRNYSWPYDGAWTGPLERDRVLIKNVTIPINFKTRRRFMLSKSYESTKV